VNRSRHLGCLLGVFAAATIFRPCAGHAAEPDFGTPYKLTVVLDVAESRVLTDVFRQQVERELREGLQAGLGELATVEVVRDHPKLAEIRKNGLGRVLDTWKEPSDVKTHFVLVDFVNNQYQIQARQYDGPTATAGPVVRTAHTPDRAFVARAVGLLIRQDFGFTATFPSWPKADGPLNQPQPVRLDLRGAGLGVPLSRFVKAGDIFTVVKMYSDGRAPQLIPSALVQVQDGPRDGAAEPSCAGRLFWRYYPPPPEGSNHAGYRCVKLGAISAPVRLQVMQKKSDKVVVPMGATVEVRRQGFKGDEGVVRGTSDAVTGFFTTAPRADLPPYDRVAFVTVRTGGEVRALLPVPLVDEQTVVEAVSVTPGQATDPAADRFLSWARQVDDAWLVQVGIFQDLRELAQKPGEPREKIVARAEGGRKRTSDDCDRLAREREELPPEAARKPDMPRLEGILKDLKKGEKDLSDFVAAQDKILKEESKPEMKAAKAQIEDAGLAEEKADYGQAIELYKKALGVINDPKIKKHVEDLEAEWLPRGEAHEAARKFVYGTWPGLDTRGLEREMESARKALEVFKSVGDKRSPRKLVLTIKTHVSRLTQELGTLKADTRDDDRTDAERIKKVSGELEKLSREALDYLSKARE
jgi:hypothetical protein